MTGLQKVFTNIYDANYWGSKETRSGGGSEILRTKSVRSKLIGLLNGLEVQSVLDAGCGDWNWMSQIDFGEIAVSGCDVVAAVVQENCAKYGQRFTVADVTTDPLPKSDLVLCRLVLNHLSFENIHQALKNINSSGASYLLATHFPNEVENVEKKDGDWRPLNFCLPPFNFPKPLETIQEENGCLGLWRLL